MNNDEVLELAKRHGYEFCDIDILSFAAEYRKMVLKEAADVCANGYIIGLGDRFQGDVFVASILALGEEK